MLFISCMQWECTFSILDVCSHPLLCFQIKVTGPDSTPVPNEPVYLFLQNGGQSENWTLTTDSKGIASFSLDTSLWTSDSVSLSVSGHSLMVSSIKYLMVLFTVNIQFVLSEIIHFSWCILQGYYSFLFFIHFLCFLNQARYQKVMEDYPYVRGVRRPEYSSDYQFTRKFHSKSKSFVKIMQGEGKFSCEKDGIVLARYIIHGVELKRGQTTLDFFYLVRLKGCFTQIIFFFQFHHKIWDILLQYLTVILCFVRKYFKNGLGKPYST